jgi:hypothetical protein
MRNFDDIYQVVLDSSKKKSDVTLSFLDVAPGVNPEGETLLRTLSGEKNLLKFSRRGLSSYLERIKVPAGFYNRCSPSLKEEILNEHHDNHKDDKVLARLNDGRVRYMGSTRYGVFDDIDILNALEDVHELHTLNFREFHQGDDNLIMRVTTDSPIIAENGRPFFPGVQFSNSETGMGSISIQFLLWEQICTNGITVPRGILKSFTKKHLGNNKTAKEGLQNSCKDIIGSLPMFVDAASNALNSFVSKKDTDLIEMIEGDSRVPKAVKESITALVPNYTPANMQPTALEVLSAYTDAIKRYTWETRSQLESIAGEYLF